MMIVPRNSCTMLGFAVEAFEERFQRIEHSIEGNFGPIDTNVNSGVTLLVHTLHFYCHN